MLLVLCESTLAKFLELGSLGLVEFRLTVPLPLTSTKGRVGGNDVGGRPLLRAPHLNLLLISALLATQSLRITACKS